jgi:hypothetical protein
MICDLPKANGPLNPLRLAAVAAVIAPVIAIQAINFDGDRQSSPNTDEVTSLQEIIPALPELCAVAGSRW